MKRYYITTPQYDEIKKRDFSKKIIALISDRKILSKLINETPENIKKILR